MHALLLQVHVQAGDPGAAHALHHALAGAPHVERVAVPAACFPWRSCHGALSTLTALTGYRGAPSALVDFTATIASTAIWVRRNVHAGSQRNSCQQASAQHISEAVPL